MSRANWSAILIEAVVKGARQAQFVVFTSKSSCVQMPSPGAALDETRRGWSESSWSLLVFPAGLQQGFELLFDFGQIGLAGEILILEWVGGVIV